METKKTYYKAIGKYIENLGLHIGNLGFYIGNLGLKILVKVIKAKVTKKTTLIKVTRKDCKFSFFLRAASSDVYVYKEVFIKKEYELLVKPPPESYH